MGNDYLVFHATVTLANTEEAAGRRQQRRRLCWFLSTRYLQCALLVLLKSMASLCSSTFHTPNPTRHIPHTPLSNSAPSQQLQRTISQTLASWQAGDVVPFVLPPVSITYQHSSILLRLSPLSNTTSSAASCLPVHSADRYNSFHALTESHSYHPSKSLLP